MVGELYLADYVMQGIRGKADLLFSYRMAAPPRWPAGSLHLPGTGGAQGAIMPLLDGAIVTVFDPWRSRSRQ